MNSLNILVPATANRIPWTVNARTVVSRLLDFQINASAFLIEAEQLKKLETEDFINDFDCAFEDLFYQIPKELRWEVFPIKPKNEAADKPVAAPASRGYPPRVAI